MRLLTIFFILATLFLSSCFSEYYDHIEREQRSLITRSASGGVSGSLSILPDKKVLEDLVREIDTAEKRIWVEIYTWTERDTLSAVLRAKRRGVDVRVILEGNVYRTPWINTETAKALKNADIPFVYADNKRFTFTHIKSWIIDNKWCIGTGNWSYTTFTKNREFVFCTIDISLRKNAETVFLADFDHKKVYFREGLDERIGLAPDNMRSWITHQLQDARSSIILYNQTVTDRVVLRLLEGKARSGVKVEICESENNSHDIQKIPQNIIYKTSKKPYLHAKIFLIDGKKVILGSANMTENAIENNRELLLSLGENPSVYQQIFSLYQNDCKRPNGV